MVHHFKNRINGMRLPGRRELEIGEYVAIKFISCATILLITVLSAATSLGQNDSQAIIKADPNPVPFTAGKGTTTITWGTKGGEMYQVYLSVDGGAEKLFATGTSGSQEAPWITPDATYQFRLYAGTEHSQLLGAVTVTQGAESNAASRKYTPVTGLPLSPETLVFLAVGGYVLLILGTYYFWERWRAAKMVEAQSELSREDESAFQEPQSESKAFDKRL